MNKNSWLLVVAAMSLVGCGTLDPRFSGLTKQLGADKTWLRPVAQSGQIVHKEGVGVFARSGGYWSAGLDLECGVYLDQAQTVVMFKLENGALSPLKMSGTQVSLTDASGTKLPRSNPAKWDEMPPVTPGGMVYGSDFFVGVPSSYPATVVWRLPDGKELTFTYNEPQK